MEWNGNHLKCDLSKNLSYH